MVTKKRGKDGNVFLKRVASLVLAVVMMLSAVIVLPQTAEAASGKTFTIKNGKGTKTVKFTDAQAASGKIWIKYTAKVDGYVKFTASANSSNSDFSSGSWTLYGENKKTRLSPKTAFDTSKPAETQTSMLFEEFTVEHASAWYGVKKNQTYCLCVNANAGTKITAKFTAVKEKSGTKESNAKTIKNKKTVTGYIAPGSKETDWYKIKWKGRDGEPTSGNILYTVNTTGSIKFTIYYKGKIVGTPYTSEKTTTIIKYPSVFGGRLWYTAYGGTTLYIKVTRGDKYSSGSYTIKVSN